MEVIKQSSTGSYAGLLKSKFHVTASCQVFVPTYILFGLVCLVDVVSLGKLQQSSNAMNNFQMIDQLWVSRFVFFISTLYTAEVLPT